MQRILSMPLLPFRRLGAALALSALIAGPAAAQSVADMSDAERDAFRAEVRAYLLENPEVLMEAMEVLEERQAAEQAAADAAMIAAVEDDLYDSERSWVGGNPEGDVTLVEFVDYRCSFCRRAHPEVEELIASDGNIRLIMKEFPILGEQSVLASRFAIATRQVEGDAAYKQVHDALITMRGDVNELSLELVAEDLGLDTDAIVAQMDSDAVTEVIRANHMLAQQLGITGTPTFVLDGQMLRGYLPLDGMRERVAEARREE